jgi:FtsP/CotA-like multicopper oxidase with cupredoxin domain
MRGITSATARAVFLFLTIVPITSLAQSATPTNPCPRFEAGGTVHNPPSLYSRDGVLTVDLLYRTTSDAAGRTLFCFTTTDGTESPTLHVWPGDTVIINLKNMLPPAPADEMEMEVSSGGCGPSAMMDASSVNMHYHGTNLAPVCHQDEVLTTILNSGDSYQYRLHFPADEPPGLYWYHPHIHGQSEMAVQGGASGAIIIEGLEHLQPLVAGLRERVLILRDQNVAGNPKPGGEIPSWDLTLNYVPIAYPKMTPAVLHMAPREKELWRVLNASADSLVDLQVAYDGVPQTLTIVGLDGVPTGSQDGTRLGKAVTAKHIFLPTAGRAEFIVEAPDKSVHKAAVLTQEVDTGPDGDVDTYRVLAEIKLTAAPEDSDVLPNVVVPEPKVQHFEGLASAAVTARRKLYFSEVLSNPKDPSSPTNFYITVDGAKPKLFSPANPPAIVTRQGSVEEWTVENRSEESHEFHIHQTHFLLLERNGVAVPAAEQQFFDTIQVPYWSGKGPYPSVKVKMDFRGDYVGDFVYHCHILGHEDHGMMAVIRVLPAK